jgi:ribonuclease BN (tRNA processing enzyme)
VSDFTLVPLGVGDAFTELYYTSCLALEYEDSLLLVDCPHPVRKMMREASLSSGRTITAEKVSGVIVTHLHADHASGLEGLGYFCRYALGRRLPLLVHPAVSERLWPGHLAAGMEALMPSVNEAPEAKELHDYFDIVPLDAARPVSFGPFSVECRLTHHHIPTTALRIRAGGRTLGHSSDTSFDPALIEWLGGGDLVIHETNYGVHTPYERLAELPEAVRKKMRLFHYPDRFDFDASVIEPLQQGQAYTI